MSADLSGEADASIEVSSDVPVVAERSMYRYNKREGSCSVGTPAPSMPRIDRAGRPGKHVPPARRPDRGRVRDLYAHREPERDRGAGDPLVSPGRRGGADRIGGHASSLPFLPTGLLQL